LESTDNGGEITRVWLLGKMEAHTPGKLQEERLLERGRRYRGLDFDETGDGLGLAAVLTGEPITDRGNMDSVSFSERTLGDPRTAELFAKVSNLSGCTAGAIHAPMLPRISIPHRWGWSDGYRSHGRKTTGRKFTRHQQIPGDDGFG